MAGTQNLAGTVAAHASTTIHVRIKHAPKPFHRLYSGEEIKDIESQREDIRPE